MGKLIGTGKDVRMMKGADYDVLDEDVEAHADLGLGDPVDPVTEMERIHAGEKQIVAEGGEPEVATDGPETQDGPAEGRRGGDVAARVESTSAEGQASGDRGSGGSDSGGEGLSKLTRDELNARAEEAGVDSPEDLPNKEAVVEAIQKAEADAE